MALGKLVRSAVEMTVDGLRFAGGPVLVPMDANDMLAIETGWDRVLCLLSVAYRKPVPADMLRSIEAAAGHWQRGNKVLANLRLVFAGLPRPDDPSAPGRVTLAAHLLEKGLSPRILMSELGLDPSVLDLVKFNPAQPRVPAGNGRESGQWGDEASSAGVPNREGQGHPPPLVLPVAMTRNSEYACKVLKLDPNKASDALHAAKNGLGLGGADNCVFDTKTGDIFYNGEHIGNLKE